MKTIGFLQMWLPPKKPDISAVILTVHFIRMHWLQGRSRCNFVQVDKLWSQNTCNNIEFTDSDSISPWAYGYVNRLVYDNMIIGYSDNTFRPKNPVTRAEAVVLVDNTRLSLMVPPIYPPHQIPAHTVRARHRRKRLHLTDTEKCGW